MIALAVKCVYALVLSVQIYPGAGRRMNKSPLPSHNESICQRNNVVVVIRFPGGPLPAHILPPIRVFSHQSKHRFFIGHALTASPIIVSCFCKRRCLPGSLASRLTIPMVGIVLSRSPIKTSSSQAREKVGGAAVQSVSISNLSVPRSQQSKRTTGLSRNLGELVLGWLETSPKQRRSGSQHKIYLTADGEQASCLRSALATLAALAVG